VHEYLAALDQSELEKSTPKNISLTDPAAQWSAAWGPAFYAYSANYLIDIAGSPKAKEPALRVLMQRLRNSNSSRKHCLN
jgi:hypothetical protein